MLELSLSNTLGDVINPSMSSPDSHQEGHRLIESLLELEWLAMSFCLPMVMRKLENKGRGCKGIKRQ